MLERSVGEGLFLKVSVAAKINLWLEVIGKRGDGYHELSTLMLPIGVYDHLELALCSGGINLECACADVPNDAGNLAWRAAQLYCEAVSLCGGVSIRLTKNIPVGAGLGGGSADAGAVLLAMNRLCRGRLSTEQLQNLARQLGADVPFFLFQRPALATGVGERLQVVDGLPSYPLVLIKPPLTVSTGWVYQRLKLTRGVSRIRIAPFQAHPWQLQNVLENDLETVTLEEIPLLAQIKKWLLEQGAVGALMSGSGPTVFGVFPERNQAERVGVLATQAWNGCWVMVTEVQQAPAADRS